MSALALGRDGALVFAIDRRSPAALDTKLQNQPFTTQTMTPPQTQACAAPLASPLPPPLPQRSVRRNSRFLDGLLDPDMATPPAAATEADAGAAKETKDADASAVLPPPTPHDVYLSSEEDASSMGDLSDYEEDEAGEYDYEDLDVGSGFNTTVAEAVQSQASLALPARSASTASSAASSRAGAAVPPSRRHSHDTARVVSVVFAGKPALVDLAVERAARRRSLNDRVMSPLSAASTSTSVSSSGLSIAKTRPSTASGPLSLLSSLSTAATSAGSSITSSQRLSKAHLQHKRNSSGSSMASFGMLASFRARTMAAVAPAPLTLGAAANSTTTPPPALASPVSATSSVYSQASPTPSPSTRTPSSGSSSFSHGASLLRGVTRSLTLSRRRPQPAPGACAPPISPVSPVSPVSPDARKSLALSVVASVTAMNAPPPAPPTPDEVDSSTLIPAVQRAATSPMLARPASGVLSKKAPAAAPSTTAAPASGGFLGHLTGRRRSLKLL